MFPDNLLGKILARKKNSAVAETERKERVITKKTDMSLKMSSRRVLLDRRKRSDRFISRFMFVGGRRKTKRRESDKKRYAPLDFYSPRLLIVLLSILLLSYADAYFTIILLQKKTIVEANPAMAFHLAQGIVPFLLNKFFLTAVSLIILCLFHDNFITRKAIKFIMMTYITIVVYQLYLLHL
ncbi:MAG: hypothetical protein JSV13_01415 [Nitrospiraceae bacterium]|jgi:hypothetical protein|nr:MAG: hypothetical protein JSV13_01415 [Nitrospiraceae bacterium]